MSFWNKLFGIKQTKSAECTKPAAPPPPATLSKADSPPPPASTKPPSTTACKGGNIPTNFDPAIFGQIPEKPTSINTDNCLVGRMEGEQCWGLVRKSFVLAAASESGAASPTQEHLDIAAAMRVFHYIGLTPQQCIARTKAKNHFIEWKDSAAELFENMDSTWNVPVALVVFVGDWTPGGSTKPAKPEPAQVRTKTGWVVRYKTADPLTSSLLGQMRAGNARFTPSAEALRPGPGYRYSKTGAGTVDSVFDATAYTEQAATAIAARTNRLVGDEGAEAVPLTQAISEALPSR